MRRQDITPGAHYAHTWRATPLAESTCERVVVLDVGWTETTRTAKAETYEFTLPDGQTATYTGTATKKPEGRDTLFARVAPDGTLGPGFLTSNRNLVATWDAYQAMAVRRDTERAAVRAAAVAERATRLARIDRQTAALQAAGVKDGVTFDTAGRVTLTPDALDTLLGASTDAATA